MARKFPTALLREALRQVKRRFRQELATQTQKERRGAHLLSPALGPVSFNNGPSDRERYDHSGLPSPCSIPPMFQSALYNAVNAASAGLPTPKAIFRDQNGWHIQKLDLTAQELTTARDRVDEPGSRSH
jgi:hypothetical protein